MFWILVFKMMDSHSLISDLSILCFRQIILKGIFVAPMCMVSPEWKKKMLAQGKSCDSLGFWGKLYCLVLIMHHHILWQMLMCTTARVCENGRANYFLTLTNHLCLDWLKVKPNECWCHEEAWLAADQTCAEALNGKTSPSSSTRCLCSGLEAGEL